MNIKTKSFCLFSVLLFLLAGCSFVISQPTGTTTVTTDLKEYFQGFDGAFVMYDLKTDQYTRYNPERCAERLLSASTFKIMNALIGLEIGIIPDENYVIPWDGTHHEIESWNQDHTLETAFQNSVVWYYAELAQRIGNEKMQQYIDAVGYGNRDIHSGPIPFWLDGTLRVSADEQVEFLKRLYENDLPLSQRSMDIVKNMMILETMDDYQLSGKTGTGMANAQYIGWFVGYQEVNGSVLIFATNITGLTPDANGTKAQEISKNILQK